MTTSSLGERLKATRELAGISARELGRLAGLTGSVASLIESGERENPAVDTIGSFARVLGVSTDWLILGTGPAPTATDCEAAIKRARRRSPSAEKRAS